MASFLELIFYTMATLLPILNPFSTAPLFLAITDGFDEAKRRDQAKRGVIYMVAILGVFLVAGTVIINVFGISLPGVRIAGGILVGRVAFRMLYPKDRVGLTPEEEKESRDKADISFFPLAMPSLSGPGSIAATLSLATIVEHWWQYIAIFIGMLVIAAIVFTTLRLSGRLTRYLGVNGMNAMTKIMGFIIFCIAVQFIVNGVTDPSLIAKFREVPETMCP
ncbi:MAG: MarC family NAAT transporter [Myxococcales bacterium]|jgi:multiple antibiotic resistance protein|nr:MarC family NAAT transporter [Myxococcales bacterium]